MACCLLERFCCCCTLRTGSLVIATIGWVLQLCQIFGLSAGAIASDQNAKNKEDTYGIGYRIGVAIVSLFITCLLVYGILKKKQYFFLPWLIMTCIGCVAITILSGVFFVMIFVIHDAVGVMITMFIVMGLFSALYWYFWACVYSHYCEVKEATEGNAGQNSGNVYYSGSAPVAGQHPPPAYAEKDRAQMA